MQKSVSHVFFFFPHPPISSMKMNGKYTHINNLRQNQPTIIPAPRALGVPDHHRLGFVQTLRTKRVALREPPQFAEKVIRIHIMQPCTGHGLRYFGAVEVREHLFDPAEFGNGVDFVSTEGVDELFFCVLHFLFLGVIRSAGGS